MIQSRTSHLLQTLLGSRFQHTFRRLGWFNGPMNKSNNGIKLHFFSVPHCLRGSFYKFCIYWRTTKGKNNITTGLIYWYTSLYQFVIIQLYLSLEIIHCFIPKKISQISKSPNRNTWKVPKKNNIDKNYSPCQFIWFIKITSLKYIEI